MPANLLYALLNFCFREGGKSAEGHSAPNSFERTPKTNGYIHKKSQRSESLALFL